MNYILFFLSIEKCRWREKGAVGSGWWLEEVGGWWLVGGGWRGWWFEAVIILTAGRALSYREMS